VAQAYPKGAVGKVPSARVVLRCDLKGDGSLGECDVLSEAPAHQGFASAAKSLAKDFHVLGDAHAAAAKGFVIDLPFDFEDPSRSAPPIEIYDPMWLKQVDATAQARLFPPAAAKAGVTTGVAKLACTVAHDGALKDCQVASETPQGLGFGETALAIAAVMQMNPWTTQGAPVDGARIVLPIRFVLPPASAGSPSQTPGSSGQTPPKS
jgi:TonB family protein